MIALTDYMCLEVLHKAMINSDTEVEKEETSHSQKRDASCEFLPRLEFTNIVIQWL